MITRLNCDLHTTPTCKNAQILKLYCYTSKFDQITITALLYNIIPTDGATFKEVMSPSVDINL